ncbi:hypothetical protein JCM10212_002259 [Sporobolomyces blumeae]
MPGKVIFYDLVPRKGSKLFYSPNTMKTRLSLLHKGVDFETVPVTYTDLRTTLKEKTGFDRVFSPLLELPDGTFLMDSWKIAEWLDATYPSQRSLFLPSQASLPIDHDSAAYKLGKTYAWMFTAGFGDSDSQWSTFFELCAEPLRKTMDEATAEYFASDAKNGPGAWASIMSKDHDTLVEHAKASILPLGSTLARSKFLAGDEPGFVDYVAYGRYIMMLSVVPDLARDVWRNSNVANVANWIDELERVHADGLREVLENMPRA